MKWLSYILTLFVVFLTTQPTLTLVNSETETQCCGSSCGDDTNSKQGNPNKDCSNENCNPFEACGYCLGFTLKTFFLKTEQTNIQSSSCIVFEENFTSQFSPEVWQPPKIV